jgi:hypothetical protein
MATLATLRSSVSAKLGLDNTAGSAEQVLTDSWCNEAVVEILLRTHCTVETGNMTTTANVWDYQLDTDILAMRDIWREDAQGAIDPVLRLSEQEILDLHRSATSSNASYTRYAVSGANLLLIWPKPSAVYTLNLLYVPRPTVMSSASHDPSSLTFGRIPTEFHKAIEYYALWQGGEYDESKSSQGGERYRALFENYLASVIRPAMRRKGGIDMPQVRRGSWRSKRILARENDRW